MRSSRQVWMVAAIVGIVAVSLFGCSGNNGTGQVRSGTIMGTAVKGPISNGTVTAYAIVNGTQGTAIASATTDSRGQFSIDTGTYTGPLMVVVSGGTYTDEATGVMTTMAPGAVMSTVITSATGTMTSGIQITPLTSMAQAMMQNMVGGMTGTNIAAANAAVGDYFMVNDIVHTMPMNPLISGSSTTATQDMRNYGMAIAAVSQYAAGIGMTNSSTIISAMMEDASDGVMNGMMGTNQISMVSMGSGTMMQSGAGTNGLATAMTQFAGSPMNQSGENLSEMQSLINQLSSSSGQMPGIISSGSGTAGMITVGTGTMGMISGGTGSMMTGTTGSGGTMM